MHVLHNVAQLKNVPLNPTPTAGCVVPDPDPIPKHLSQIGCSAPVFGSDASLVKNHKRTASLRTRPLLEGCDACALETLGPDGCSAAAPEPLAPLDHPATE
ncbi:hypothetical protein DPEC_G00134600 [Dallia pectoralis]|uniref:Uncharacterized protein n=1 Tax=Dallia pectoralis TaxID=75939 RepID=A0ACC2GRX7_DALPE|nr:hypothetical protein DPEC_G00134600 [Dallia pectoralis]